MPRPNVALVVSTLAATAILAGCGARAAREDEKEALEQRIEKLEQALAASTAPSPEATVVPAPPPAGAAAPAPARRSRPAASRPPAPVAPPMPPPVVADSESRAPEAPPAPRAPDRTWEPARLTLPEGTRLDLVLEKTLSTRDSRPGDEVTARVEKAVSEDGDVLLPGGAVLLGRVTEAVSPGRVKGRARLSVTFDRIVVRGVSHDLEATPITAVAPESHGRDAAIVGGGAVAGAILGAITGGRSGAAKGVLAGGAAGTGAVLLTRGQQLEIPAGSRWFVTLSRRVRL